MVDLSIEAVKKEGKYWLYGFCKTDIFFVYRIKYGILKHINAEMYRFQYNHTYSYTKHVPGAAQTVL